MSTAIATPNAWSMICVGAKLAMMEMEKQTAQVITMFITLLVI